MKKIIVLLLTAAMLCTVFAVGGYAYGSTDNKLIVTHIDDSFDLEGAGMILTPATGKTIGSKGTFAWWVVITFEWDASQSVYVVKQVNKAMNSDKSSTEIPANGFAYCVNTGNNWPALVEQNPATYGSYKDKPNYVTDWGTNSTNYAGQVTVGSKAYLYGTDILNSTVSNNGRNWYDSGYVSNSYIKIGSPDGSDWYDPTKATVKDVMYDIRLNRIGYNNDEGVVTVFTRDTAGETISTKGYEFSWWKTATFDWDQAQGYYVCVATNLIASGVAAKGTVIPQNGFVLAVNLGNNYAGGINYTNAIANSAFATIESVKVGSKAFLSGIDLEKNTAELGEGKWYDPSFESDAHVYIGYAPEGAKVYKPSVKKMPASPVLNELKEENGEFVISWSAVDGASDYYVTLYDATICSEGKAVIKNVKVSGTEYRIKRTDLTVGYDYNVAVTASAGGTESIASRDSFFVYSESAANSPYRGKTIVAFGDSLTAFTGWVGMMKGELGTNVINSGVGGDTTIHAKARFENDVLAYKPDVVILNFGMNDQAVILSSGKNNVGTDVYEKNYRYFIEELQKIGTRVILVTAHYVCTDSGFYTAGGYGLDYGQHDNWNKYVEVQKKLAAEYKLERIAINELCLDVGLNKLCASGDGIHLSALGQEKYTEWIGGYLLANTGTILPDTSDDTSSDDTSSDDSPSSADSSLPDTSADDSSADTPSADASSDAASSDENSADSKQESGAPTWLIIVVIATLVLAVAIVVIFVIRKKK